jgi:hypothetical protein
VLKALLFVHLGRASIVFKQSLFARAKGKALGKMALRSALMGRPHYLFLILLLVGRFASISSIIPFKRTNLTWSTNW